MSSDEVTQIKVGGDRIGIIGLKSILSEVAEKSVAQTDEEIGAELLKRFNKRNYIPESSKEKYGPAFLREFKKFTGQAVEDSNPDGPKIKVLGPGCLQCNQLEQDIMAVMNEMGLAGNIEHVTDINAISEYGVMGTPALILNGKVMAVGSVPPKAKLKSWLKEISIR
jgi:small redox-active disulfide protein 2